MRKFTGFWFFMLFMSLGAAAFAAEKGDVGEKKIDSAAANEEDGVETTVVSDSMISESGQNRIRFIGNVVAQHGNMTVKSDELEIYSDKEQKKMKYIIATGSVVIKTETKVMRGGRAELYQAEKKLVLTGNASITEGDRNITGEKIIYFYDKEDIIVGGGITERATFKVIPAKENRKKADENGKERAPPE